MGTQYRTGLCDVKSFILFLLQFQNNLTWHIPTIFFHLTSMQCKGCGRIVSPTKNKNKSLKPEATAFSNSHLSCPLKNYHNTILLGKSLPPKWTMTFNNYLQVDCITRLVSGWQRSRVCKTIVSIVKARRCCIISIISLALYGWFWLIYCSVKYQNVNFCHVSLVISQKFQQYFVCIYSYHQ